MSSTASSDLSAQRPANRRWRSTARHPPHNPAVDQLNLDISLADSDPASEAVLAIGAVRRHGAPETGFRGFEDPAGHPFCRHTVATVTEPRFS
ncbi:VOC family protein [Microlunatus speluncae]|uniref:VOC family protein n=1 Tax=Microlunatus speluncae TaxID=2594267 RepID=UPI001376408C